MISHTHLQLPLHTLGHNVLIFAYGVTNAGKTYTMAGNRACPGVLPRTLDSIFQAIEHQQSTNVLYKPKGSYVCVNTVFLRFLCKQFLIYYQLWTMDIRIKYISYLSEFLGFASATQLDKESAEYEASKKRKLMSRKLNKHYLISDMSKLSDESESQASTTVSTNQCEQEKSSRINPDPFDCR